MFHLLHTRITRPYRSSVALEEERVWIAFYRRVANPAIAAEVLQHLDADADLKRTHPALHLRCRESLRTKKARQARTKRFRNWLRRILGSLLRDPASAMQRPRRHGARNAVEGSQKSVRESASNAITSRPQLTTPAAAQPDASRPSAPRLDSAAASPNAKAA